MRRIGLSERQPNALGLKRAANVHVWPSYHSCHRLVDQQLAVVDEPIEGVLQGFFVIVLWQPPFSIGQGCGPH